VEEVKKKRLKMSRGDGEVEEGKSYGERTEFGAK